MIAILNFIHHSKRQWMHKQWLNDFFWNSGIWFLFLIAGHLKHGRGPLLARGQRNENHWRTQTLMFFINEQNKRYRIAICDEIWNRKCRICIANSAIHGSLLSRLLGLLSKSKTPQTKCHFRNGHELRDFSKNCFRILLKANARVFILKPLYSLL